MPNSKTRRAMMHRIAVHSARGKFMGETKRIERQQAHLRYGFDRRSFSEQYVPTEVKKPAFREFLMKHQGHPFYDKKMTVPVSSASIPDSFVSRTDKTDYLFRQRDTRAFYRKRDKLVSSGGQVSAPKPLSPKLIAWAKSKGIQGF